MSSQQQLQMIAEGVMVSVKTTGASKVHVTISAVNEGEMSMTQVWDGFNPLEAIALNTLHGNAVASDTKPISS